MMQDLGTTLLIATPSYALYIAEVAESMGIDPARDLKLRVGLFGGKGPPSPCAASWIAAWASWPRRTMA